MLNLSHNRVEGKVDRQAYKSFGMLSQPRADYILRRLLIGFFLLFIIIMMLPWTQNIRANGTVTTLRPEDRPQSIHAIIPGRIEKWYVREGMRVNKGDTLVYLSEIKEDYMDPALLSRTGEQIKSKELSIESYAEKVNALDNQIAALANTRTLKMEQARNDFQQARLQLQSDSIDLEAAKVKEKVARDQLQRMEELYKQGLKSLTDLESRRVSMQQTMAARISAENKLLGSRNKLINARLELSSVENEYNDKLAKARSEKFATLSGRYESEAELSKLQNQLGNYAIRSGYYYITAPQSGFVTRTIRSGIGETIKEGEDLITIMPADHQLAVALYIRPVDLPLLQYGQTVRLRFDGWPSVVFSGWPNLSYSTFGGEVVAIDNFTGPDGKYRILVAPDPSDVPWPEELRVGSGADGMALLKDVALWYEIWRKLNGFPPDYYKPQSADGEATY